ncbi:MAG: LysM peptidoglycan-binding domain-containing protein [Caldilineaceae bacterium]|nr:LysM peptidoglycan-binding domain-containing protein [Caldilineaceae bacterium]
MNRNDRFSKPNAEDYFATAASRLEAGESIPDILASYPPALHDELLEMLAIVQVTDQIRSAPVPRPPAARRAAAKRAFLATAAQMHADQLAQMSQPQRTPARPISRPAARRAARRRMSPWERFTTGLQDLFGSGAVRLAPLVLTVVVVLFSTTTLVSMAQSAVPGDWAYTLKQWIRQQELEFAPENQQALVRQEQERELAEDVAKAANRADANSAIIQAEDTQVYYGRNGRLLKVGGLTVMDRYQPDANLEVFKEMTIEGDLQPGARVDLTYQIMPGQSDTVQGIALAVVAPPNEAEIIEVDLPANELPQAGACSVSQPEGWVPYTVQSGDNLTFLANRGGTTVSKIAEVNCLESEIIVIGAKLLVPADSLKTDLPLLQCGSDKPANWVLYEVQAGDNLSVLAERGGVSVADVMAVNCLDGETIVIGAKLYLPENAAAE